MKTFTRRWFWLGVAFAVYWAGVFGIAFAVVEWRDTAGDADQVVVEAPVAPAKRIGVTEAVELAKGYLLDDPYTGGTAEFVRCGNLPAKRGFPGESPEFNLTTNQWIVPCMGHFLEAGTTESYYFRERYLTDPVTGHVTPIP